MLGLYLNLCLQTAAPESSSLSVAVADFPPDLDIMASSSFPAGTAVKFWVPNLGARVPVDLTTGLPDYSEYVRSGLWVQRRRLRVCDEGNRSWPDTFPVSNMKICQTYCHMEGVTQERVLGAVSQGQLTIMKQLGDERSRRPELLAGG